MNTYITDAIDISDTMIADTDITDTKDVTDTDITDTKDVTDTDITDTKDVTDTDITDTKDVTDTKPDKNSVTIKPINVLIVEDNRADIRLIEEIFKKGKLYINLQSVENGQEAIFYLKKENQYKYTEFPDLILLDLNMPVMNGFEFLENIKQDENFKHIPIIVMTVSKSDEDVLKSYNLHANAYIVKPVELNQFISAVQSIENFWLTIAKLPPKTI